MNPKRVRVEGDLFHGQVPEGAVYCGRAAPGLRRSFYHNPYKVGARLPDGSRVRDAAHAVELFRAYVDEQGEHYREQAVADLGGRDLACWCGLGDPCHVDHLLVLANPPAPASGQGELVSRTAAGEAG